MRFSTTIVAVLAGVAAASPSGMEKRQATQNDLMNGACKKVTLVFARASTEGGNMGGTMGPAVCSGLRGRYPNGVSCQGVGPPYSAGLADNVGQAGTTQGAINEAVRMFTMAFTKCPQSTVVAGGYSQGSAVILRAVEKLPPEQKSKIVGIVLFGYTKNAQTQGSIPGYPKERLKVFCAASDGVCGGALNVNAGHFSYMADGSGPQAVAFLASKINGGGGSIGSGGAEASAGGLGGKGKGKGKGGGK